MVARHIRMAHRLELVLGLGLVPLGCMELGMVGWRMGMDCRLVLVGPLGLARRRCMGDWRMGMGCRLGQGLALVVVGVVGRLERGMVEWHRRMGMVRELGKGGPRS